MEDHILKRKSYDKIDDNYKSNNSNAQNEWVGVPKFMTEYISKINPPRRVKQKLNNEGENQRRDSISIKISVQKGFFNIPKEVIVECLMDKGVFVKLENSTGRGDYYYKCIDPSCKYKIKIIEKNQSFSTTSANLIRSYKTFDLSMNSDLDDGFAKIVIYDEHIKNHNEKLIEEFKKKKQGNI